MSALFKFHVGARNIPHQGTAVASNNPSHISRMRSIMRWRMGSRKFPEYLWFYHRDTAGSYTSRCVRPAHYGCESPWAFLQTQKNNTASRANGNATNIFPMAILLLVANTEISHKTYPLNVRSFASHNRWTSPIYSASSLPVFSTATRLESSTISNTLLAGSTEINHIGQAFYWRAISNYRTSTSSAVWRATGSAVRTTRNLSGWPLVLEGSQHPFPAYDCNVYRVLAHCLD